MRSLVAAGVGLACVVVLSGCRMEAWLGDALSAADGEAPISERGPCLIAVPQVLDFENVGQGESRSLTLSLRNTCEAPVALSELVLSGSADFAFDLGSGVLRSTVLSATEGITFDTPYTVAPGGEHRVPVAYTPTGSQAAFANAVWLSDDPQGGFGLVVKLRANVAMPCLVTYPKRLDFGGTLLGEASERNLLLNSCGDTGLTLKGLRLAGEGAERFEILDLSNVQQAALDAYAQEPLSVRYRPSEASALSREGLTAQDNAYLIVESDAYERELSVPLTGFGALEPCPHAVITPGNPAALQSGAELLFDGSESYGVGTPVVAWEWTLIAPEGSDATLEVTEVASRVRFSSNALGAHEVRLSVIDAKGITSCVSATHVLNIVEPLGLAIELWWAGQGDLDLHFLHELALGLDLDGDDGFDGWFDKPFDAFWANPAPNWGQLRGESHVDDPLLLFDDYDGFGPERIVLAVPEAGRSYRVGVHHWEDHQGGPVDAWVRVFLHGELVVESSFGGLAADMLWELGEVSAEGAWVPAANPPVVFQGVRKPWPAKGR